MALQHRTPTSQDLEHATHIDQLSIFREAVGITEVLSIGPKPSKRVAQNVGIYQRVVSAEKSARTQYYASAALINSCILLQIVFAAVLTSLGAANGSYPAITGIGAANTVIAGLLSFTKGQGLPNRLMQYRNTLRKVREYIEQRERDFAQLDCKLDLQQEIKLVVEMYQNARKNDEANDPNAYHQSSDVCAASKLTTSEGFIERRKPAPQIPEAILKTAMEHFMREETTKETTAESGRSEPGPQKARHILPISYMPDHIAGFRKSS